MKLTVANQQVSGRFTISIIFIEQSNIGTHILADAEQSIPGGVDAYIFDQYLGIWNHQSCRNKISGRRNITRNDDFLCVQVLAGGDCSSSIITRNISTEMC